MNAGLHAAISARRSTTARYNRGVSAIRSLVSWGDGVTDLWTCGNCREIIEGQFDACWRCRCSREGKLNWNFDGESKPAAETASEHQLDENYQCPRCTSRDTPHVEKVAMRGAGMAIALRKDFLAVSCRNCGLTEFFSLSILEGARPSESSFADCSAIDPSDDEPPMNATRLSSPKSDERGSIWRGYWPQPRRRCGGPGPGRGRVV